MTVLQCDVSSCGRRESEGGMIEGLEHTPRIADQAEHPEHLAEPARLSRKGQRARERREELVQLLRTAREPIVGAELARRVGVSRQMLTHDLTLLRLSGVDIMATRYGYMLRNPEPIRHRDVLHVQHDRSAMVDEMTILVDLGIRVLDIGIDHPVYGPMHADLCIASRHHRQTRVSCVTKPVGAPVIVLRYTRDCCASSNTTRYAGRCTSRPGRA